MSIDATRIEKIEVEVRFPIVSGGNQGNFQFNGTLREKDAKTLMHSLAGALGYICVPNEPTR